MCISDLSDSCMGPNYTFCVEGVGKSYIDHCVVSGGMANYVSHCEVLHDTVQNTSDHLPLVVHVRVSDLPKLQYPDQTKSC